MFDRKQNMAPVARGVGEADGGFVDQGKDSSNPVTVNKKAGRGESTRVFGYRIGEERSQWLTLVKVCCSKHLTLFTEESR